MMWMDADDVMENDAREKLCALKTRLDEHFDAVMMPYHCGIGADGKPSLVFERERIVRRAAGFVWEGAVHEAIRYAVERGITIGAICAAPMIIGKLGYLSGHSAICYPGFEKYLIGANISAKPVVTDENFITAKGMGAAPQFGLALVPALYGEDSASELIRSTMMQ